VPNGRDKLMGSNRGEYTIIDLAKLRSSKVVCLTLDVEQDYGGLLHEPSYEGFQHIPDLVNILKAKNIPLTCFVQGSLFDTHPSAIEQLSALDAEFEVHAYSHPGIKEMDTELEIKRGKDAYRKFFGKEPLGYRAPLGFIRREDYDILVSEGFKFDSSIFPSLMPGVFNNLSKPTRPYFLNNPRIVEFPLAVFSNLIRIPIGLSYVKLLGKPYFYLLKTGKLPNLIVFDFHLHDLHTLSSSKNIPFGKFSPLYRAIYRRVYMGGSNNGMRLLQDLVNLFSRKGYRFLKLIDIYNLIVEPA
jgi:peptidoglycan/xylan/chitin deacetylase (PgdA/CDA1 family)